MFTIGQSPDIGAPFASDLSPVDASRNVAIVPVVGRGQAGGGVWVLVLNGARIPFETMEWTRDEPLVGEPKLQFGVFGWTTDFGHRDLGELRYEFRDEAERRVAQMLAIEGVLFSKSREGILQRKALRSGLDLDYLRQSRGEGVIVPFHFGEKACTLVDFGYALDGGIRA